MQAFHWGVNRPLFRTWNNTGRMIARGDAVAPRPKYGRLQWAGRTSARRGPARPEQDSKSYASRFGRGCRRWCPFQSPILEPASNCHAHSRNKDSPPAPPPKPEVCSESRHGHAPNYKGVSWPCSSAGHLPLMPWSPGKKHEAVRVVGSESNQISRVLAAIQMDIGGIILRGKLLLRYYLPQPLANSFIFKYPFVSGQVDED